MTSDDRGEASAAPDRLVATTLEAIADGPRGQIWLDRPDKLNPLGVVTLEELVAAARWFDDRPAVKIVTIGGRGRAFSGGADLGGVTSAAADHSPREAADAGRRMADAIEALRAVTIARIQGHCVGGAVVLATACDLRVAAAGTRFAVPEVDLGIPLTWGGVPRLVREIGPAMTKELVLTCRPFGAEEAKEIGLVNRVVPDDRLDAELEELVGTLVAKSALTLTATKQHVNAITDAMVAMGRTWNDADSLVVAQHDPESRAAAAAYLQRLADR